MAKVVSVAMNDRDIIAVQEDGSVFFYHGDPNVRGAWVEGPPVPRTEAAGRANPEQADQSGGMT
jgi:hypothetical protein